MNPAPSSLPAPLFELRVLDGAQRGASAAVRPGVPLMLGADWRSDVVLRAADAAPLQIEMLLADGGVELQPQAGRVQVDDTVVEPGTRVRVPLYRAITVNGTRVALGELGAADWGPLFGHAAPTTTPMPAVPRRPWPRWLATGGAAVAATSLSMLALAFVAAPDEPAQPPHAQAPRARPDAELALAVGEVFRLHGLAAEVEAVGPGRMRVHTTSSDAALLQRAQADVQRDVPGLAQLELVNVTPAPAVRPIPALDDPGKRIASIVSADPAYVVTSDGTRYFTGALLPSGHRIVHIAEREVQLELGGQPTRLAF